jgi:replicative DNA helicase
LSGAGKGLYEQITSVSKSVADMRKTLDRPIVALAQLNRKLVGRATGDIDLAHFSPEMTRPNDADVRDSGQVEQSADVLMFLNRPIVYLENLKPTGPDDVDWQGAVTKWRNRAELIVHMNRSGPRGIVDAMFREGTMGFSPV